MLQKFVWFREVVVSITEPKIFHNGKIIIIFD